MTLRQRSRRNKVLSHLFYLKYYIAPRALPHSRLPQLCSQFPGKDFCSIKLRKFNSVVFLYSFYTMCNIKLVSEPVNGIKVGNRLFKMNCKQYYILETIYVKPKGNDVAALYIAIFVSKQNEFAAQSKRESD